MSKAEGKALEKYPIHSIRIVPARGGGYYADRHLREGFIDGYHQAEKDLELTWEDVRRIYLLVNSTINDVGMDNLTDKSIYQEVLKRFKKEKEMRENVEED